MDRDDWVALVAHIRAEFHRYFPDCPISDMGVRVLPACGLEVTLSPDDGKTEMRFVQTNHDESDAEWFAFRTPTRRTITIPFAR
jgi:hypothetical protein